MTNTRFSVALHVLVELAKDPNNLLSSSYLAERVNAHPVVVRRLIQVIKEAGLITAIKGSKGGVRLAIDADSIPLSQVAEITEENFGFTSHQLSAEPYTNFFSDAVLSTIESERRKVHLAAVSHLDGITVQNVHDAAVLRSELNELVHSGLTDQQIRAQFHIKDGHLVRR